MDLFSGAFGGVLAILLLTSFIKFVTALNILRYGIGLRDLSFGLVIIALSFALSVLVIGPRIEGGQGIALSSSTGITAASIDRNFRPLMEQQTDPALLKRISTMSDRIAKKSAPAVAASPAPEGKPPLTVLIPAFLISELKIAFSLGLMFLIPFVVIDVAIANILLALGTQQFAPAIISLPLKLLLFIALDGWTLVSEKLLAGYL